MEYPTPFENVNLNRLISLKYKYPKLIIGYSDHSKPDSNYDVIKTAYNLGALVIEKNYTLDKALPGNNHYHSMDSEVARNIVNQIEFIDKLRGTYTVHTQSEDLSRLFARRSIVSNIDIKIGDIITREMLAFKRPGTGIPPYKINDLIGKTLIKDVEKDTILTFDMVS